MQTIKTLAEWVEYVGWVTGDRSNGSNGKFRYYYRGEPEDYGATGATPGIGRGGRLGKEAWLFREAERRLPDEFASCKSTFEKLVLMQHYQLPTRLLDISMNALSALFFACYIDPDYGMSEEKEGRRDGAIYIYKVPEGKIKNYHSDVVSILSNIAVYDHPDNLDIRNVPADEGNDRQIFNSNKAVQYLLHEIRAEKPYFKDWIKKKGHGGHFLRAPVDGQSAASRPTGGVLALWHGWGQDEARELGYRRGGYRSGKGPDSSVGEKETAARLEHARHDCRRDLPGLEGDAASVEQVRQQNTKEKNMENQQENMAKSKICMIKGVVETLSSDGTFRIRGAEGYFLEKDDKTYNVFWETSNTEESGVQHLVALPQKNGKEPFSIGDVNSPENQRNFQLLASAKASHQKVELEVELEVESSDNLKSATVTKVTLL